MDVGSDVFDWLVPFYNFRVVASYSSAFLSGFALTLGISALALVIALTFGTAIAVIRLYGPKTADRILSVYVQTVRSTPLLVQVYLLYYALGPIPGFGRLTALQAGILALGLNEAAYFSEIIRSGLRSIDQGQMDAARALGLGLMQSLRLVVLPVAVKRTTPPLIGQTALLIKDSSVVSFIGVIELTGVGLRLMSERLLPNEGFLTVAAGYLLIYVAALFVAKRYMSDEDRATVANRSW